MKKLLMCLLGMVTAFSAIADGTDATISTNPSTVYSNKAFEVTITTGDFGSEVYCYTWCEDIDGKSKTPSWSWKDVEAEAFRMSGDNGTYTFTISNIKEFYGLTDAELAGLTKLGFIAKTKSGAQTIDLFVAVVESTEGLYSGGTGVESDPYIIATAEDLTALIARSKDWVESRYFKMSADIDASSVEGMIGTMSNPFKAHFNGDGHCVKDYKVTTATVGEPTGLFAAIDGAEITDLGVFDADVTGTSYVGALVGYAKSGTIARCFSSGKVTGSSVCVGGLVGENVDATITDCYSMATVDNSSDYATGGLVGKNSGTIRNTYASGAVSGYDYAGGLVGANYGSISNSVALNPNVTSANDYVARFGGNDNVENQTDNNHSWDNIANGQTSWSNNGDHATSHNSDYLAVDWLFKKLTGWDFNNVWQWRTDGWKGYPVLRNMSSQERTLPEMFYDSVTGVDEINKDIDAFITVGPNPTAGEITINATVGVQSAALYNLSGALMSMTEGRGATAVTIDMSMLPSGIYVLAVQDAHGSKTIFKIIKK